ncbi:MAG TPA: DNA replication and repair protein RecF, partial [Verrucomicrobiae bacterium]|nr:DNA replication and repair protein RecF [Verrucomicrobiae bacterium]
ILAGFSQELVSSGREIIRLRRELVPEIGPLISAACRRVGAEGEEVHVEYLPSARGDFAVELAQSQARERVYRFTVVGPHRDDLQIQLNDRSAAQFSSEGQKRMLAIGFKMAQAEYLSAAHGSPPILLIDDILGELDAKRRAGFVPLLEKVCQARGQIFMTATEENWEGGIARETNRWQVNRGTLAWRG